MEDGSAKKADTDGGNLQNGHPAVGNGVKLTASDVPDNEASSGSNGHDGPDTTDDTSGSATERDATAGSKKKKKKSKRTRAATATATAGTATGVQGVPEAAAAASDEPAAVTTGSVSSSAVDVPAAVAATVDSAARTPGSTTAGALVTPDDVSPATTASDVVADVANRSEVKNQQQGSAGIAAKTGVPLAGSEEAAATAVPLAISEEATAMDSSETACTATVDSPAATSLAADVAHDGTASSAATSTAKATAAPFDLVTIRSDNYVSGSVAVISLYRKNVQESAVRLRQASNWIAVAGADWAWGMYGPPGCNDSDASVRVAKVKVEVRVSLPPAAVAAWKSATSPMTAADAWVCVEEGEPSKSVADPEPCVAPAIKPAVLAAQVPAATDAEANTADTPGKSKSATSLTSTRILLGPVPSGKPAGAVASRMPYTWSQTDTDVTVVVTAPVQAYKVERTVEGISCSRDLVQVGRFH